MSMSTHERALRKVAKDPAATPSERLDASKRLERILDKRSSRPSPESPNPKLNRTFFEKFLNALPFPVLHQLYLDCGGNPSEVQIPIEYKTSWTEAELLSIIDELKEFEPEPDVLVDDLDQDRSTTVTATEADIAVANARHINAGRSVREKFVAVRDALVKAELPGRGAK